LYASRGFVAFVADEFDEFVLYEYRFGEVFVVGGFYLENSGGLGDVWDGASAGVDRAHAFLADEGVLEFEFLDQVIGEPLQKMN
jgi:hypothetical protein